MPRIPFNPTLTFKIHTALIRKLKIKVLLLKDFTKDTKYNGRRATTRKEILIPSKQCLSRHYAQQQ